MVRIILNVSEGQKALWVDQAFEERVSLSEWIRRRCDGGLGAGVREGGNGEAQRSPVLGSGHVAEAGEAETDAGLIAARTESSSVTPAPRPFRPDPKVKGRRGLGSGEVPAAGSPPVAGAAASPVPSFRPDPKRK